MTPTEDEYVNRTASTKEYEPRTCCMATVEILGERCRDVNDRNAPKYFKSRFAATYTMLQTFLYSRAMQGCPRHRYKSWLANCKAVQYVCMLCQIIDAIRLISELIVFMHYVGLLIALPCPRVTFCCVVLETRSYTCANVVALYSYLFCTLGVTCAAKRIKQLSKHTRKCDVCCTILYLCCVGLYLPSVLWPQSHKMHTQSGPYRQVDLSIRLPIPAGEC